MKKYVFYTEKKQLALTKKKLDELILFQDLLRNFPKLNRLYHGKALEMAEGLQPWIDALEIRLKK